MSDKEVKKIKDFFKARTLDDAESFLRDKYGSEILVNEDVEKKIQRVPTGLIGFDKIIGGGIPLGRVMELYGPPGSGKTTLCKEIVKAFQARQKKNLCLYLDYEHSIDLDYAETLGVDTGREKWRFCQPT